MARRSREFEIKVGTQGADRTKRDFDDVAQAEKRAGGEAEELGRKGGMLGRVFGSLQSQVVGMVASFVSIGAVVGVFRSLVDIMQQVLEKAKEINREGLQARESALLFAQQLGDVSEKGQRVAFEDVTRIAKAGALSFGAASELGIAADVAFSDVGGIRGPERERVMATTELIAGFAGKAGVTPDVTSQLLFGLQRVGALESPEATAGAIGKIERYSKASKATNLGEFLQIFSLGSTEALASGMSFEQALELTQLVKQEKDTSSGRAGEAARQITRVLTSEKASEFYAKQGIRGFLDLPMDERFQLLQETVSGVAGRGSAELLLKDLTDDVVRGVLTSVLRKENVGDVRKATAGVAPVSGADVRAGVGEFMGTDVARGRKVDIDIAAQKERAARALSFEQRIRQVAKTRADLKRGEMGVIRQFYKGQEGLEEEEIMAMVGEIAEQMGMTRWELMRGWREKQGTLSFVGETVGMGFRTGRPDEVVRFGIERAKEVTGGRVDFEGGQPVVNIGTVVNTTEQGKTVTTPRTSGPQM